MQEAGTEIAIRTIANTEQELSEILISQEDPYDPYFNEVSSLFLVNLKRNIDIEVRIKDTYHNTTISISQPIESDLKWAKSLESMDTNGRHKALRVALEDKNTWRVAYMCKIYEEQDNNEHWIDPNYRFRHNFLSNDRKFITIACHDSSFYEFMLILQLKGCNAHGVINYEDTEYKNSLEAVCHNKDEDSALKILVILLDVTKFDIKGYLNKVPTKAMKDLLSQQVQKDKAIEEQKNIESKQERDRRNRRALEHKKEVVFSSKDNITWRKMNDEMICKLSFDGDDFRLRSLFNFAASTITETNEYLNDDLIVTYAVKSDPQPMGRGTSKREILEAQKMLKKLNL